MVSLARVRAAQPEWFSRKNRKFFGDIDYKVLMGKRTGRPYLVRRTLGWTDRQHWRVNFLNIDLTIGKLLDTVFRHEEDVKDWLKTEAL